MNTSRITNDLNTSFFHAVQAGNLDLIKQLLQQGVQINQIDINGYSAFLIAAKFGQLSVLQYLKECGVAFKRTANDGKNAFILAAREGHLDVLIQLKEWGFSVKDQDHDQYSVLMNAIERGQIAVVEQLLNWGASFNQGIFAKIEKHVSIDPLLNEFLESRLYKIDPFQNHQLLNNYEKSPATLQKDFDRGLVHKLCLYEPKAESERDYFDMNLATLGFRLPCRQYLKTQLQKFQKHQETWSDTPEEFACKQQRRMTWTHLLATLEIPDTKAFYQNSGLSQPVIQQLAEISYRQFQELHATGERLLQDQKFIDPQFHESGMKWWKPTIKSNSSDGEMLILDKSYPRIRYGHEDEYMNWLADYRKCPDCGVKKNSFHNTIGCDMERCPACGEQSIGCACWPDESIHEEDDWSFMEVQDK